MRMKLTAAAAAALALALPAGAGAFAPAKEVRNLQKTHERARYDYGRAGYQTRLRLDSAQGRIELTQILATDGPAKQFGRNPLGNLCPSHEDGCAGDVRFWHWGEQPGFVRKLVLYTARNGSTISGHVWYTLNGPAKRPGIVITNGSIQAPEELYGFAAATLAKAGYVVLTWDPQGQGRSDTFGQGADRQDGVPSQEGRPFYDGTEDALDFFFSTPASRYVPRRSCTSGTSHDDKQRARVASGRNAAFNPAWSLLDTSRVGIAGHSLGAGAVSYIGQLDPRVKAIVAWDNLRTPETTNPCASGSSPRPASVPITRPALGLSNDYGLVVQPFTADPDPLAKGTASEAYSEAGVDTGELVIRGGTHYEFSYIPNPGFPASLRGMDMAAWYTTAWFDKYVKGDPGADARLLSDRWRRDARTAAVDEQSDGNVFSFYYRSRLDVVRSGGGRARCLNIRSGCSDLAPDALGVYSYLAASGLPDELAGAHR